MLNQKLTYEKYFIPHKISILNLWILKMENANFCQCENVKIWMKYFNNLFNNFFYHSTWDAKFGMCGKLCIFCDKVFLRVP
jgi:hypothetical protein